MLHSKSLKPTTCWTFYRKSRKSKNRKLSLNYPIPKWATKALYLIYTPTYLKCTKVKNRRRIPNCYTLNHDKKHLMQLISLNLKNPPYSRQKPPSHHIL